jgi:antibiotic biosynthesis monooxygenase (ABM) superfamily enzyme
MKQHNPPPQDSAARRILVGYLGLYPTLLLVLTLLGPVTHHLSFPLMVLVEVAVLVPVTQLVSFPLIRWLLSRLERA